MLEAAGVLELVYQQMTDTIGDGHGSIGGQTVGAIQHALGDLRDFGVVHGGSFCKDHMQLGYGAA